jgi:FKBP-type peptidyl-prolyl cis-trans isomerase
MSRKVFRLFIFLIAEFCYLHATSISICIDDVEEGKILNQFFKMGVEEEEYGYVLEGVKPVSVRGFYSLDQFPVSSIEEASQSEFTKTLLVRAAIPVWNKCCLEQKSFSLKAVSAGTLDSITDGMEVRFVNIGKLREVVEGNINLFRYILDPSATVEQIVNKIAYSEERLIDILQQDLTLMGIVLGFGSYSSLVGGRIEEILSSSFSKDSPPFSPRSYFIQKKCVANFNFLSPERYGHYYLELAGGERNLFFKSSSPALKLNSSFPNIEKELLSLQSLEIPLPPSLREFPAFIFSPFKGEEEMSPFFDHLKQVQKRLQSLIKKSDFLSEVLEKIGGKKPSLNFDKLALSEESSLGNALSMEQWQSIFSRIRGRFEEKKDQEKFAYYLCHSTSPSPLPKTMFASKSILKGLEVSLQNLEKSNNYFKTLSERAGPQGDVQEIFSKGLYFKRTFQGEGEKIEGACSIRLNYVVENTEGEIFFADYDAWIPLSKSIPGFAYGVQGMKVGEERTLFIHPSFGYGVLTALPPCESLLIKVHLLEIRKGGSFENLPPLEPLDLSWIQDPSFRKDIEEAIAQQPQLVGSFYREALHKAKGLNRKLLINDMCKKFCPSHQ